MARVLVLVRQGKRSAYLALDFFDHVVVARGHDGLDLVAKLQRTRELVEQIDAEAFELAVRVIPR